MHKINEGEKEWREEKRERERERGSGGIVCVGENLSSRKRALFTAYTYSLICMY